MRSHEIVVIAGDSSCDWWPRLWRAQRFRNWEDAHEFLDSYQVRIRTLGGTSSKFVMIFPNEFTLAEFALAWM